MVVVEVVVEEVVVGIGGGAFVVGVGRAVLAVPNLSAILRTRVFHRALSRATVSRSLRLEWGGTSIRRLPDLPICRWTSTTL